MPRYPFIPFIVPVALILAGPLAAKAQVALKSTASTVRPYDYSAIDRYALTAPASAQQSIASLAAYFSQKASNDREKARAVYIWIANNISYDYDSIPTGRWEQQPEGVLKVRSTDCLGRSRLFEQLAKVMGLESVVVGGKTKTLEANPQFEKYTTVTPEGAVYTSHSWNAVKIEGTWQLVDVTAAGGKDKKQGKLEPGRPVDPYFFLVPASVLIYSHLPNEDKWQLLDPPVSKEEHARLPLFGTAYFKYDMQAENAKDGVLHSAGDISITMKAPSSVAMCCELREAANKVQGDYAFAQRSTKGYEFYALTPHSGKFLLRILVRALNSPEAKWEWIGDFAVEASAGSETRRLPFAWDEFQLRRGFVFGPASGVLNAGTPQSFRVYLPDALSAGIKTGGQIVPLERQGDVFAGTVVLAPGEVLITGRFADRPDWNAGLVRYMAR